MKVLITGANGMVARATSAYCRSINDEVIALTRKELDISDANAVRFAIDARKPDAIINCAAFTDVDGAESNAGSAILANTTGVENLAASAKRAGSRFVTISTDYVFDGTYSGFYTQRHTPAPRGVYATSKLAGERKASEANANSIIVRSGWIYGEYGTNFLSIIPKLLSEGRSITAINDSYGTPTFAGDLAKRLRELVEVDLPCVYHVTNSGPGVSYLEFAQAVSVLGGYDGALIESVSRESLQRPAPRPANSKLACIFSERFGLAPLPDWKDSLRKFVLKQSGT